MATLSIIQEKSKLMPQIPHKLLINGQLVGILQGTKTEINIPAGTFRLTIQSMIPFFSASRMVHIEEGLENTLQFKDRERWWDVLFTLDIILWIVHLFVSQPEEWDLTYEIFTNGYLILWLGYEWLIHKKYFRLEFFQSVRKHDISAEEEPRDVFLP